MSDTIKVLDHGFVSLIDHMGNDKRITDAARISYAIDKPEFDDKDVQLLRYLMRHHHWSPFEMVEFTFRMKLPIFVARQLVRHRTAGLNEISGRYTQLPNEMYVPEIERLNKQSKNNKQGSESSMIDDADLRQSQIAEHGADAYVLYEELLNTELSKELSRMVLPLNTYTEWYWKIDLRNLFNLLKLRLDSHAQYEIRVYAEAIYELIRPIVPHSCRAFENYILEAVTFSRQELDALSEVLKSVNSNLVHLPKFELLREFREFAAKMSGLGYDLDAKVHRHE